MTWLKLRLSSVGSPLSVEEQPLQGPIAERPEVTPIVEDLTLFTRESLHLIDLSNCQLSGQIHNVSPPAPSHQP